MNSRRKGHDGEREVAALLRQALGIEVARNLQQTRDGGHDIEVAGFALEIKRASVVTEAKVARWWQQALDQADRAGLTPVLVFRADRQPWRVRMRLSDVRGGLPDDQVADLYLDGFVGLAREGLT